MVEVRLMQRTDKTLYVEVLVHSVVRANPQLKLKGILERERLNDAQMAQRVGLLAGALAEELCERYDDKLEPSESVKEAIEAYKEMVAENPHIRMGDELPRAADVLFKTGLARRR